MVAIHSLANAAVVLSAAMERQHELWDKLWVALTSLEGAYLCPRKVERVAAQMFLRFREEEPFELMSFLWCIVY